MTRLHDLIRWGQKLIAQPQLFTIIVATDIFAYFAGLLFWYGGVMASPFTPAWAWPFIPDCPLFGLLGGLGLLMVTARDFWSDAGRQSAQRVLWWAASISLMVWFSTYLPGSPVAWSSQAATIAVWAISLLIAAIFFQQAPAWFLGIAAFGQIKYGIWTVLAWLLYWQNTAKALGAPDFNFISILMTVSHLALIGQGLLLLTYFRPDWRVAIAGLFWFGLSDYMDYGLNFHPAVAQRYTPIEVLQWSTIATTILLTLWYLLAAVPLPVEKKKALLPQAA